VLRALGSMGQQVEARDVSKMAAATRHMARATRGLVEGFTSHDDISAGISHLQQLLGQLDVSKMAALRPTVAFLEDSVDMIACKH